MEAALQRGSFSLHPRSLVSPAKAPSPSGLDLALYQLTRAAVVRWRRRLREWEASPCDCASPPPFPSPPLLSSCSFYSHCALSGAAAKPSFGMRLKSWGCRAITGPSVSHSILFGVGAGFCAYAGYYLYRAVRLTLFDTENVALQSRLRYAEKQKLFQQELDRELAAGHIASLVAEYDPVATRLPFQPLQDRYRV
ncbi:hypothetical protein BESB_005770 [Besnoitia besnoiti]|uniref:Transmembrane protein n=1 Tax=Besnoitia besnoiti TaxID=94643 RepID=A0A2A9MPG4_BESBE|nr:hypothetical protein BESB_005770 [Besnoitia besnoiti]PFH38236.1 hypothetical protein BESB_005770 [Besnoitia besnoiti]